MAQVKVAVSVIAEFIVIVAGFAVPAKLPVPVAVHLVNLWPEFALAVIVFFTPELYQPLVGLTVPGPLTFIVRKYWCWNAKPMVVVEAVPVNAWAENHR